MAGLARLNCRQERQSLSANSYWPVGGLSAEVMGAGRQAALSRAGPAPTREQSAGGAGGGIVGGGLGHDGFEGVAGLGNVALF